MLNAGAVPTNAAATAPLTAQIQGQLDDIYNELGDIYSALNSKANAAFGIEKEGAGSGGVAEETQQPPQSEFHKILTQLSRIHVGVARIRQAVNRYNALV